MFTSKTGEWYTPFDLYEELNKEFHFTTDPCTTEDNPLGCRLSFTKKEDGLIYAWLGNVFINPPYGKGVSEWIERAKNHAQIGLGTVVMLLPARTDTKWFHDYIYNKPNVEIRFLKGRIKFRGAKNGAPFPSMLVIFKTTVPIPT